MWQKQSFPSVAGPASIGRLIDAPSEPDAQAANDPADRRNLVEQKRVLEGLTVAGPYSSLVATVPARAAADEPRRIALFAELLTYHRDQDSSIRSRAILTDGQKAQLVAALLRWVSTMMDASDSSRAELVEFACAIGSVSDAELADALDLLLSEELRR